MSLESAMQRMGELNTLVSGVSAPATGSAQAAPAAGFSDQLAQARTTGSADAGTSTQSQVAGLRARMASAAASVGSVDDGADPASSTVDVYGGSAGTAASDLSSATASVGSPYGAATYGSTGYLGGNGYGTATPGVGGVGSPTGIAGGSSIGTTMVALAQRELGQEESPPGSNDSARIREYRSATAGAENSPGPWCAYFVSYLARSAGAPIGANGSGFGWVGSIEQWGKQTGRFFTKDTGTPQPGDIVLFGTHHTGIVESVDAGGRVHTIEGNSSNRVQRRDYDVSAFTGFVRPG